jgi:4-aminobutyrate aminotransferase
MHNPNQLPDPPLPPRDRTPDVSEGDINLSPARRDYRARNVSPQAARMLDADERVFLRQSLSTPCLNALVAARGSILTDAGGRELLDFHGNSVHQVGHGHPRVIAAIKAQLDRLPFCPRRYTNDPAITLAERLGQLTDHQLPKVLFAPGGTLAMGMAMKLARLATGRFKFLSMWGSFHGASLDAISIGGEAIFRAGLGPLLPGCEHVAACAPSRCSLGCGGRCTGLCAAAVEDVLEREPDIAAVIIEPIRCTTIEIPPREYLQRIRAACTRRNTLLIFDEIPLCLGRTGEMFAYELFGVTPDILVIGKGLGGGIMPIAAMLARADLDIGAHTALGHYTHEKSPVAAAAAIATLDVIRDEDLCARSRKLGETWHRELTERLAPTGVIREVRGTGLMLGVELAHTHPDTAPPDTAHSQRSHHTAIFADRVLYACLERGLSFKVSDGRVLTLTPPLTVSEAELARATSILADAIRACL